MKRMILRCVAVLLVGSLLAGCGGKQPVGEDAQSSVPETAQAQTVSAEVSTEPEEDALPDQEIQPGHRYVLVNEMPEVFRERLLSNAEIEQLKDASLETLREKISTFADFNAWLEIQDAMWCCNVGGFSMTQRIYWATHSMESLRNNGVLDSPSAATLAIRILGDDFPGIGMIAAVTDYQGGLIVCGNTIPTENGYYIYSADVCNVRRLTSPIMSEVFPLLYVRKLEDVAAYCGSDADISTAGSHLKQLFYVPGDVEATMDIHNGKYVADNPAYLQELDITGIETENPSALPTELTRRKLSDSEIAALKDADMEELREKISTPADYAAWLDTQDGTLNSNVFSAANGQRTYGADFYFSWWQKGMESIPAADSMGVRILGDDLPGMGQIIAFMEHNGEAVLSAAVIPTDGGYYVYSLGFQMKKIATANCLMERVPYRFVRQLTDLVDFFGSMEDVSCAGGKLKQLFFLPGDTDAVLDSVSGLYRPQNKMNAIELYRDEQYANMDLEQLYVPSETDLENFDPEQIKPENVQNYALSQTLGGVTLTAEEAYELLSMSPEQVKERVKTAGDLLMYMLAAKIGDLGGDREKNIDGVTWHYNISAKQVLSGHLGNCGSMANLANYLLEGDYEEIGFVEHAYYIGNGGGHVYNYIRQDGSVYIVDFSWYIFNDYRTDRDFPVMRLNSLEEYGHRVSQLYGGVCLVFAHTSPGKHLPNVFDDDAGKYAVPQGADYTVLYQKHGENCYELAEYPLNKKDLDWTSVD